MTLSESTTGILEQPPALEFGAGDGEPTVGKPAAPDVVLNTFSASTLTDSVGSAFTSAATSVKGAAANAGTQVTNLFGSAKSKVSNLFSGLTGGSSTGAKSTSDASLTWLWVVLAAGAAFLVYHFTKGKGKGKSFFKPRASGSHVKPYGK